MTHIRAKVTNSILRFTGLTTLLVVTAMMTGCATSGRYVALKEFNSSLPSGENSPLQGRTICVKPFVSSFNIEDHIPDTNAIEPPGYIYIHMTADDTRLWADEVHRLKRTTTKADWIPIGNLRNGFGAVMSKVYALDDPGLWLTDALKEDLQKLGAHVADPSQEADADLTVGGTIMFLKIDIYMKYWADLIVNVELKQRNKEATNLSLHTTGGRVAWTASSWEYYQPLRECQQKFSRVLIGDMEQLPNE